MKYLQHAASRRGKRLRCRLGFTLATVVAISGVVLGTASSVLAGFDVPKWIVALLVVGGGVVAVIEIVRSEREASTEKVSEIRSHVRWFDRELPIVREVDPFRIGVTRSRIA